MTKRRYKANRVNWRETGNKDRDRYEAYKRAWKKQFTKLDKRGLEMEDYYIYEVWEAQYDRIKNDLQYEVNIGKRRGIGNVNQYIVRQQAYELSSELGEATYKAFVEHDYFSEEDKKLSKSALIMKIRQGQYLKEVGWWDKLAEIYHKKKDELIKQGVKPKEATKLAKEFVSWTEYNSPGKQ